MTIYSYKAINQGGRIIKGQVWAYNEEELNEKLKQAGLELVSCKKYRKFLDFFSGRISIKEMILMCVYVTHLDRSGVSILDIIAELRDNSPSNQMQSIMMDVHDGLKKGKLLSAALANHPKVFDDLFIGLVAAGEKVGSFADAFSNLEKHLRWTLHLQGKIKHATYYPVFLFALIMTVMLIMMTVVVPKIAELLAVQNIPIPWYTHILITFSAFILNNWGILLISPLIAYVMFKFGIQNIYAVRFFIHRMILKVPFIGKLILKLELARFCRFFIITYKGGMGIIECLNTSNNVISNVFIQAKTNQISHMVREGKQLSEAMQMSGTFPSIVIRMFKVAESSGNIEDTLQYVNEFYDQEINESIDNFIGILQPVLTIFMALLLMWITISVFGPIYSNFGGSH